MDNNKNQEFEETLMATALTPGLQQYYSTFGGKIFWVLFFVGIFAIVGLIRFGNTNDYLLLLLGAIVSFLGVMCYIIASLKWGIKNKKGIAPMFLALGGLIPWAFGLYLFFTRGLVVLFNITGNFSISAIFVSLFSMYLGYLLASNNYKIVIAENNMKKGWNAIDKKT